MWASSGPSVDVAHLWAGGPTADARPSLTSGSPGAVACVADLKAPRASLAPVRAARSRLPRQGGPAAHYLWSPFDAKCPIRCGNHQGWMRSKAQNLPWPQC